MAPMIQSIMQSSSFLSACLIFAKVDLFDYVIHSRADLSCLQCRQHMIKWHVWMCQPFSKQVWTRIYWASSILAYIPNPLVPLLRQYWNGAIFYPSLSKLTNFSAGVIQVLEIYVCVRPGMLLACSVQMGICGIKVTLAVSLLNIPGGQMIYLGMHAQLAHSAHSLLASISKRDQMIPFKWKEITLHHKYDRCSHKTTKILCDHPGYCQTRKNSPH